MHTPPALEDVLDVVRRYLAVANSGALPRHLAIHFHYGDKEVIRLPIPSAPVAPAEPQHKPEEGDLREQILIA
jgi:hypothetical protein